MLPTTVENEIPQNDFEIMTDQPSKTYYMNLETERVIGLTDNQAAMKQAIFKILQTELNHYDIYTDYGVELEDLIGMPIEYVVPEAERRITEALMRDDRIVAAYNFSFEVKKNIISTTFYVDTVFGTVEINNVEVGY